MVHDHRDSDDPFTMIRGLPGIRDWKDRGNGQANATCPAHGGSRQPLWITRDHDGHVILTCKGGCTQDEVLAALGLEDKHRFPAPTRQPKERPDGKPIKKAPPGIKRWKAQQAEQVRKDKAPPPKDETPWVADQPRLQDMQSDFRTLLARPDPRCLARCLGVRAESLERLGVGYWGEPGEFGGNIDYWTFPMLSPAGLLTGFLCRQWSGNKWAMKGTWGGLYYAKHSSNRPGPILVVEGLTDTAAADSLGLAVVGRFSAESSRGLVADLLRGAAKAKREIIVVADQDDHGKGQQAAEKLAAFLTDQWRLPVYCRLPPGGKKDLRGWLNGRVTDVENDVLMGEARAELLDWLGR